MGTLLDVGDERIQCVLSTCAQDLFRVKAPVLVNLESCVLRTSTMASAGLFIQVSV